MFLPGMYMLGGVLMMPLVATTTTSSASWPSVERLGGVLVTVGVPGLISIICLIDSRVVLEHRDSPLENKDAMLGLEELTLVLDEMDSPLENKAAKLELLVG